MLRFGNHPLLEHPAKHVGPPLLRRFRIEKRRITRGGLRQTRNQSHLGQGEVANVFAVVVFRRRFHSVRVMTEVDVVQVQIEDLLLGQLALQAQREDGLADLPGDALLGAGPVSLGGDQHRLGGLLGERRSSLDRSRPARLFHQRLESRPRGSEQVNAHVVEEIGVLRGDERLDQPLGDLLVGNHLAPLVVELAREHRVIGEDLGDDRWAILFNRRYVGQAAREAVVETGKDDHHRRSTRQRRPRGDDGGALLPAARRGDPTEDELESGARRAALFWLWRHGVLGTARSITSFNSLGNSALTRIFRPSWGWGNSITSACRNKRLSPQRRLASRLNGKSP